MLLAVASVVTPMAFQLHRTPGVVNALPLLSAPASAPTLRVAQPPVALSLDPSILAMPVQAIADRAAMMQNAPLSFGALYFLCELLIPINLGLAPIGGVLYGFTRGLAIVAAAGLTAATAAFFIGRAFRERVMRRLAGSPAVFKQFVFIDRVISRGGFRALLLLRLIPTPIPAINFLYGLTSVAPHSYIVATAVGNLPGTAAIVSTGTFGKHLLAANSATSLPFLATASSSRAWCTQPWCAQPLWAYAAIAAVLVVVSRLVADGVRSAKSALEALSAEEEEECAVEQLDAASQAGGDEMLLERIPCIPIPDDCRPWSSGGAAAIECATPMPTPTATPTSRAD